MNHEPREGGDFHIPGRVQTESEKRWLSWSILTAARVKHSYAGTVTEKVKADRRRKNKVAKASRKANR
jgi:hypothetical protein